MKEEIKELRQTIASNAKFEFPDYSKKFKLECDASQDGMGSVLLQEDKIIGYFSKKLHGSELNYSIVEKEYLSIVLGLLHLKRII